MNLETNPLVSIGAINYNNSKYVIDTLESIRLQTYPNIELIIVDDCSTDDSPALIEKWLEAYDKPYKLIKHERNLGLNKTCNSALRNASGQYFNLIATDDIMMPDKIKIQVELLSNASLDTGVVYSDASLIKEDGSPRYGNYIQMYKNLEELPSGNLFELLLKGNFLPAMSPLIKMEALSKVGFYDEDLQFEDFDMWLRLAKDYKFLYSDYVSVKYRMRGSSLVKSIKNWNPSFIKIYLKYFEKSPVALKQLLNYARDAYRWNDKESLRILEEANPDLKYLKFLLLLSKLPINRRLGLKLLEKIL